MTKVVYLDNNATTRLDDDVAAAMTPLLTELYGNASSTHHFGAQVGALVETARGRIANLIGARDREIVFTSGGTESNNAALHGALAARPDKRHIVISAVEHAAVLEPAAHLQRSGVDVTQVGVSSDGALDLAGLGAALRDDTALVSIMLANNETGAIFPIEQVVTMAHERGALVHVDAVQAVGKIPVDVAALGLDLLSVSAHKLHGPKGVGALFVRRGAAWRAWQLGGPQERGRRGGTLNTPAIVGFGRACELAAERLDADAVRVGALRDTLEAGLCERVADAYVVAGRQPRLPNTSCICIAEMQAEPAVMLLSEAGICVSSGAACSSGSLEPSHVLAAMGVDPHLAQGQLRLSLSRYTTDDEVNRALDALPRVVAKVRGG